MIFTPCMVSVIIVSITIEYRGCPLVTWLSLHNSKVRQTFIHQTDSFANSQNFSPTKVSLFTVVTYKIPPYSTA